VTEKRVKVTELDLNKKTFLKIRDKAGRISAIAAKRFPLVL
jgi:hypothetical protein